ncbi:MAG: peptide deformylase [Bacteroidales bacterium]|nr:peptide deformylase [Bacteroidales bacterium]
MKFFCVAFFILIISFSFYHCKKENELPIVKDSLFFTSNEASIIFSGDTTQPFTFLNASLPNDLQILQKKSKNVKVPNDTTLHLYRRMLKTIKQHNLTSIAAPEIGINRNIIIVKRKDKTGEPFEVLINPVITQHSNATTIYNETCATLPNNYPASIARYNLIFVEYYTIEGKKQVEMIETETASYVQHAITHLGGGILPTTQDPLAFTGQEIDSIMAKPDSIAMRILLTTNYQDSLILRKQSINVRPDSNDIVLKTLIKRMKKALDATSGVGIAAPQVGINRNVIWVKRLDRPGQPFEVYLNPKIVMTSQNTILFNGDGCLSIPGITGRTRRFSAIGIEYDLLDGTHKTEVVQGTTMSNFTSVIFQHEIDHLNGILFIDRIE